MTGITRGTGRAHLARAVLEAACYQTRDVVLAMQTEYVDGFVFPVPKKNVQAYRRMASKAGKIWREHGALLYMEAVADDVKPGKRTSFPQSVKLKDDETALAVEGHGLGIHHVRQARVLHHLGVDLVAVRTALEDDVREDHMIYGGFKVMVDL